MTDSNAGAGSNKKISLLALTAMVVGSMVGAGIFNLPATFGAATSPFGALISWAIAGTGMYMLARVFQALAEKRPDIDAGVFGYAKAGFGNYLGFLSAFGFWLGSCLGNAFYWILIGTTLSTFFPGLFEDNLGAQIVVSLVGIWLFHFMILRGIEQAAFVNFVVTVAKIVPLLVVIVILVFAFNFEEFTDGFFVASDMPAKSLMHQIRDTMLITVFVFIGIEGASVYSRFAKTRADVGRATILGFVAVTGLMVAITILPYGVMSQSEIAGLSQPSVAGALEAVVGPWGGWFISVAVLIAVLGAYLTWTLMCAEILFATAKSNDMPKAFASENPNRVPANALWMTNVVVSLFVISTFWSADAFNLMLDLTSVATLLPYLLVAGYGVLLAKAGSSLSKDLIISWVAVVYTIFMFIAAGPKYIILVAVLYAPGTILYAIARREQGALLFTMREKTVFGIILVMAVIGVIGLATGYIEA
jgi:arginine:ornithine antiporter/lysine permease